MQEKHQMKPLNKLAAKIRFGVIMALPAIVVWSTLDVLRTNAQNANFTEVAVSVGLEDTSDGAAAAWGDYDNDGDLDLFVANGNSGLGASPQDFLYRNDGEAGFVRVDMGLGLSDESRGGSAAWGDYDNDGDLDLVVAGLPTLLYRNDGAAGFTRVNLLDGEVSGNCAVWGDYDNDNDLDLFIARSDQDFLFRNDGEAGFVRVDIMLGIIDDSIGADAAWADYDNDGDLDLFVANGFSQEQDFLYRNDVSTGGGFVRVDAQLGVFDSSSGRGVAWGDYDNDGDLDLYVANDRQPSQDFLYRNDLSSGGGFVRADAAVGLVDTASGRLPAWADYDHDGDLDLYVANTDRGPRLYRNDGAGGFIPADPSPAPRSAQGAAWGDYDNDGDLDLFVPSFGRKQDFLYRNNGFDGKYLIVRALTDSNGDATDANTDDDRDAIGARIEVERTGGSTPAPVLVREISGGHGSQSQLWAHFGLATDMGLKTVTVRVRFPDGTVVVENDVAVNQLIVARDR